MFFPIYHALSVINICWTSRIHLDFLSSFFPLLFLFQAPSKYGKINLEFFNILNACDLINYVPLKHIR